MRRSRKKKKIIIIKRTFFLSYCCWLASSTPVGYLFFFSALFNFLSSPTSSSLFISFFFFCFALHGRSPCRTRLPLSACFFNSQQQHTQKRNPAFGKTEAKWDGKILISYSVQPKKDEKGKCPYANPTPNALLLFNSASRTSIA